MIRYIFLILLATGLPSCSDSRGQQPEALLVGGPCEGCEAVFEYGQRQLKAVDTLPGFNEGGERIRVTGTVYENDGKTPAEDAILYVYHTNREGIYEIRGDESGWGRVHGYIRGWVQTGSDGRYSFYTRQPGSYPTGSEPAHIHLILLEPDGKYYWADSYHFKGDPLLTDAETNPESPRGGTAGVLTLQDDGNIRVGSRDIILGRHIPGYDQ